MKDRSVTAGFFAQLLAVKPPRLILVRGSSSEKQNLGVLRFFPMWQRRVCVLFELSNSTTTTGWLVFLSRSTRLTFGKYLRPDNSEVQNDNGDNKQRRRDVPVKAKSVARHCDAGAGPGREESMRAPPLSQPPGTWNQRLTGIV